MSARPPLLETRALTRTFGEVRAVDRVDFRVDAGELRCLIGPNGAGKSTFFHCLTGQLRPIGGSIRLGGEDVTGARPHAIARRGVAIKTQVPSLFDGLSVRENVRLAAWRCAGRAARARKVDEVLALTGLGERAADPAGTLPHGERQRLELGLAIAADPVLMLLDEPAAGMTGREVARTADLVRTLARDRTVIVVEHDLRFIGMIADRVTVFHQGRILAEGPAEAVLQDPEVRRVYLGPGRAPPPC